MPEWSNGLDSKSRVRLSVPWVRIPPSPPVKQKWVPTGPVLLYKQRVRDENPVRQNAAAFWTHAVRPGGVRIALRRFESIPPSPPVKQKWVPTGPVLLLLAECVFGDRHRDYVKPPFRCFDLLAGAQTAVRNRLAGRITQLLNSRLDMQRSLCRLVCPTN